MAHRTHPLVLMTAPRRCYTLATMKRHVVRALSIVWNAILVIIIALFVLILAYGFVSNIVDPESCDETIGDCDRSPWRR